MEKCPTLRERIVDTIKEAVTSGTMKPGERVHEPELAERFGISRTPIREAFRQLEIEGFITVTPRRGAIVSKITDKDVREFYEIKGVLEGCAAKISCSRLTEKELQRMEHLNKLMTGCAERGDAKTFSKIDNQFHDVFLRACGNEKLWKLLHNLVQQFERFRMASISLPGRMMESIRQHEDIVNAFRKKDAVLVERLVKLNAERGAELLVQEILREK